MRFTAPILSLFAAVALAQQTTCNTNCILVPNTGLNVAAGQSYPLTWSNPSSGQITIKLQPSVNVTPTSGITLAANVDASTGKYSVTIPSNLVNSNQYTFEIIDQSNPSNINFSPMFAVSGATGVSSAVSSTGTASSSGSSSASTRTSSSSGSISSSSSATASSSASTGSSTSATQTSSQSSSRTSSSATSTATTAAPNSNSNSGASSLKVEGALVALVAAVMAAF